MTSNSSIDKYVQDFLDELDVCPPIYELSYDVPFDLRMDLVEFEDEANRFEDNIGLQKDH